MKIATLNPTTTWWDSVRVLGRKIYLLVLQVNGGMAAAIDAPFIPALAQLLLIPEPQVPHTSLGAEVGDVGQTTPLRAAHGRLPEHYLPSRHHYLPSLASC